MTARAPSSGARRPDQSLSRERRLTRSCEIREAFAQGRRWVGRTMVLWRRDGPGAAKRLGVVASRKVGGSVQRSRARRRLREVFRRHREDLTADCDVVLVGRRALVRADWGEVEEEFLRLARRAGLMGGSSRADRP